VVIDACTRRVVGWAMADHLHRELVLDALGMALHQRKPVAGLIHHRGHGVQYTSIEFGRTLRTSSVVASMGSIGDAFDNAMAESFFATLKEEMIYRRAWPTRHEPRSRCSPSSRASTTPCGATPDWATSAPPPTNSRSRHRPRCPADGGHFTQ
jgi:transposase InsO family protein